ncbi:MAG: hypothetical protein L0Z50_28685 [Verrucomicrobiales bacterium]|nr:hypothetical protein [Verrucomicrobiales bacterium]
MNTPKLQTRWSAYLTAALLSSVLSTHAQHISEPDTTFYGRIVQRLAGREFLVTSGALTWTFKTSGPGGREHRFSTKVEALAEGQYSYRLRMAHQLLAYDLTVASSAVALPSAGARMEHIAVTLNGQPLVLTPLAADSLSLSPQTRATAHRIDLELAGAPLDSDADGLPDWWEDGHGLDKWNPADAAGIFAHDATAPPASHARGARTFAEWRAALFPPNSRALGLFERDDPDSDGIPNLFEYAFDLDPHRAEPSAATALPHVTIDASSPSIIFRKRLAAMDLQYHIEVSSNLTAWSDGSNELEQLNPDAEASGHAILRETTKGDMPVQRFFRVRVVRFPYEP